ncbi:MAG: hypothetical protein BEN19_06435 [Epulopiscium sp. Nuni2H_MBin003]|nr:MAG: hypothetical protein BEN19_06435 [Epulopiscium sp. Nuni2H_MBin003]
MAKMRKIWASLALLSVCIISGCNNSNAASSTTESTVQSAAITDEIDDTEQRIIPLSVALVEIFGELGIEMAGVPDSQYELHPAADGIPTVGLSMNPDIEKILELDPTDVVALTTLRSMIEAELGAGGIEPLYVNLENIDEFRTTVKTVGEHFDKVDEAAELLADFNGKIDAVIEDVKQHDPASVLILFGFPGNYMVATDLSFVGQLCDLLGAENVAGDQGMVYLMMNLEELMVRDPDVIFRLSHGIPDIVHEMFETEFSTNPLWAEFSAVQNGHVYDLDDSIYGVSATLNTPNALRDLADLIYQQ